MTVQSKMMDFGSPMLDVGEHLSWIFGKTQGYRCLAFLDRDTGRMTEKFYEPRRFGQMCADIKGAGLNVEVFYCPLPMATASRWKGNSASRWIVWADIDNRLTVENRRTLQQWGFWLVSSGTPGNVHAYAKVDRALTEAEHRGIQEGLRDRFGADDKIADNDLLRVAGTMNYKNHSSVKADKRNQQPHPVEIVWRGKVRVSADKLIARLGVVARERVKDVGLPAWDVSTPHPRKLSDYVRSVIGDNDPGDRSAACMAAVAVLCEHGLTRDQIHVVLDKYEPGNDKYNTRWHSEIDRLWTKRMNKVDGKYETVGGVTDGSAVLRKSTPGGDLTEWDGAEGFWNRRTMLTHIYRWGKAHQVPIWSLFGCHMAQVMSAIPPNVTLPRSGTLNLLVALVGLPGDGKDLSINSAKLAVQLDATVRRAPLGSGQGIVHQYRRDNKGVIENLGNSVLFESPEIDKMTAHSKGTGSTLDSELRNSWSGGQLGGAYSTEGKRVWLESGGYRLCAIVGVQPERAAALMGGVAGGLPQRFLWFPAYGGMEKHSKPYGGMTMAIPEVSGEVQYSQVMNEELDAERYKRSEDRKYAEVEVLSTHDLYNQCKVAAFFALSEGRMECNDEDWELAGVVMGVSSRERDLVVGAIRAAEDKAVKSDGRKQGMKNAVASRIEDKAMIGRCKAKVVGALKRKGDLTRSDLRDACGRTKEYFAEALIELMNEGKVAETDSERGTRYTLG